MKTSKTRTRVVRSPDYHWGVRSTLLPVLNSDFSSSGHLYSTQTTESEGHRFASLGRTNEDVGGEFFSSICTYNDNCPYISVWSGVPGNSNFYRGTLFPKYWTSDSPLELVNSFTHSDNTVLDALGATAISRTIPTNPVAGLSVTFGEFREGFPRLIGSSLFRKGDFLKKSGEEWLNLQFGLMPLISDFKRWLHAYRKADALWDQFLRDSGRRVRRRYTFPKSTEVIETSVASASPAGASYILSFPGFWQGGGHTFPLHTEIVLERNRWFSGSFTYCAEFSKAQQNEWKKGLRRVEHLYGAKIDLKAIWDLAPWSWAVDWFGNTGEIINNLTRFAEDGLVMPYGYMMELSVRKATYRMRDVTPTGYHIPDMTQVLNHTVKYRRRATPFGFGLNEGSFTPRQLSILAALGLTRAR
jgi:hypothetical protein